MSTTITTFDQAHSALRPYYNNSRTPYTLDAMHELMDHLGNPQEKIRVVHIAGTSGKTSTAYYTSALLVASGKSAGLFVSPHVDEVNERLQINGALLPEVEYCAKLTEFLQLIKSAPIQPSYFELLTAMAYWEFARRGLDYAVMEVGLGGLLDATNVVKRTDKICVITDIGLDHTEILGDTIEQIAAQKAGIIQTGNQVYMHKQPKHVVAVVEEHVQKVQAHLTIVDPASVTPTTGLPLFQQRNLALAAAAVQSNQSAVAEAAKITIPARLESFKVASKTVIVDGSHNEQKLTTMFASLKELYGDYPVAVLCSFMEGNSERWQGGLKVLLQNAQKVIFTSFHGEQDMPKSSVPMAEFVKFCENQGYETYDIQLNPEAAFAELLKQPQTILLTTGSFYLLNHVRPLIVAAQNND